MPKKSSQGSKKNRVAGTNKQKLTRFQRFGLFFYDRRETTLLFWVTLVIFGILSYTTFMQRQGFPAVDVPVSVINGTYFVNDREQVDSRITQPASDVISQIPEVDTVRTYAGGNFFIIITQYDQDVTSSEGNRLVQDALDDAEVFPEQAQTEFRAIDATRFANEFDILVAVHAGEDADVQELEQRAEFIAGELQNIGDIERTDVLQQYETGVNPQTGQEETKQQKFDQIGLRKDGETVFYPSVTIGVLGNQDANAIELSDTVQSAINELKNQEQLSDLDIIISADFAESITQQVSSLQKSLLQGLLAVLLVSFLLISWRASVTSALAMTTVILITLGAMYITGNTLNTITLFALILSLGLIVDDTTIMVEAIDAAKRESRRKRDIIALALKRVARASSAGTLTTILGFAPMLFIMGVLGDFIRILPVTIIISLTVSLLLSLILVPLLASGILLRNRPKDSRNPVLKLESMISNGLSRLVLVAKRSRPKGVGISFVAFLIAGILIGLSGFYFQKLQFNIFPNTKDGNTIRVEISYPPTTDIGQAKAVASDIDSIIAGTLGENVRRVSYRNAGDTTEATATIDLVEYQNRDIASPELVERLQVEFDAYEKARVKAAQIDIGPPAEELPFRVQVDAEDPAKAQRLAADIESFLQGRTLERDNGSTARITRAEIADQSQIVRVDSERIIEVQAGYDATDTSALVNATQQAVEEEYTPQRLSQYGLGEDALTFDFGAESENQESFSSLLVAIPILLVAIYVVMALQFKSFLQPIMIFTAVPFSFFGVAAGLYYTDNPLSFFVMIGFLALIGIAVNNTILLTDYANQARKAGAGRIDAMASSIRARFRPLLTTSLTSVVALLPLALTDPFWESISFTLIFGLLSSTFLVVIAFPYVYLAGEALRIFGHKIWIRELPNWLQYPLDILVSPLRLISFLVHLTFRHTN